VLASKRLQGVQELWNTKSKLQVLELRISTCHLVYQQPHSLLQEVGSCIMQQWLLQSMYIILLDVSCRTAGVRLTQCVLSAVHTCLQLTPVSTIYGYMYTHILCTGTIRTCQAVELRCQ
jgi:hypothetical protein